MVGTGNRRTLRAAVLSAGLLAAAAAAAGYAAHHAAPLAPHSAMSVVAVAALAAMLVLIPGAIAAGRRHAPLPDVVVVTPRSRALRPAGPGDIEFCAALHAATLAHGFFVALGPAFLRAYHRTFIESPYAFAWVAAAEEHPIGFVVGVTSPRAQARWTIRHHGVRLAFVGAAALATRPVIGLRFVRTRLARYAGAWRRHRDDAPRRAHPRVDAAVLEHIAVAPGAQGAGVGGELVDAFVERARAAGAERAVLLTLDGSDGAGAFYAARGWQKGPRMTTPDGHAMREWALMLNPEAA